MKDLNNEAFISLFRDAYKKCYGNALTNPLSETESKHFANKIFEDTGLVIGAKSIKNYAAYIVSDPTHRQENPSVSTLDTLARYVLNAPYTDEIQRKTRESHYPYWFEYKSKLSISPEKEHHKKRPLKKNILLIATLLVVALVVLVQMFHRDAGKNFIDNFHAVHEDSLEKNGWFVKAKDTLWWSKRNNYPSHLTLYTLPGDNWPDSANSPGIKNLLLRSISSGCFAVEIHLDNFMPKLNWQQAGILLLEDTTFTGKTVRLSIAYNDFFGGYSKPKEIIIQAISVGGNVLNKPEEIAHLPIFSIAPGQETLVSNNLQKSGLRIEKNGKHFRFLYSAGPTENFSFKEAFSRDLELRPKFIGLFAIQGFVNDSNYVPAHFKFFSLSNSLCE